MTEQTMAQAVQKSVTVPLGRERAFELFVEELSDWWPTDSHHVSERPFATAVLEAHEGGRLYERDDAGQEYDWGRVLSVERPARILIAWQLTPEFRFDPDPSRQTEVEVVFEEQDEASTRVVLEHRGFEVHGRAGGAMREAVGGEGGWQELLDRYVSKAPG